MSAAPPVIRHASNLMRDIEVAVLTFPRRHRYVAGQDLRGHATKVAQLAIRAWRRPEKRVEIVDSLVDAVDDMKLSMQLAKELHAFASFRQFEDLARKASELGREVGGWNKHLHPQGQNAAPRAVLQRARTLSTRAASNVEANS